MCSTIYFKENTSVMFTLDKLSAQRTMDKAACIKSMIHTVCACQREKESEHHVISLKKLCVIVIRHCAFNTSACALQHTKLFPEQECNGHMPVVLCASIITTKSSPTLQSKKHFTCISW